MSTYCGFTSFTKLKYKKKYIPSARECHWHRDRGDPWLFHCRFPGRKLQCEMLCYYPCFVAFWQTWFGIFVESALIQSLIPTNGENPVWKRKIISFIKTHLIQRIHQFFHYESTIFFCEDEYCYLHWKYTRIKKQTQIFQNNRRFVVKEFVKLSIKISKCWKNSRNQSKNPRQTLWF